MKAGIIAVAILGVSIAIWYQTAWQWQQDELAQLEERCKPPECTFTYDPLLPNLIVIMPAIIAFFACLSLFEKRRLRTWRSYR